MEDPAVALKIAVCAWLASAAAIVAYRFVTGAISTSGLVRSKSACGIDPERVQMLLGTVAGAGYYVALSMALAGSDRIDRLPDMPELFLTLLGGSQFLYLAGKVARKTSRGRGAC